MKPVKTVLSRLKAQGLLFEPDSPRVRMCFRRDESDLRLLCLEHGLSSAGDADRLTERLLAIDPTGWLMGYPESCCSARSCSSDDGAAKNGGRGGRSPERPCRLRPPSRAIASALRGDVHPQPGPALPIKSNSAGNTEIWRLLKGHAQQTARAGNLALCRNVHLAMANHLLRRNQRTKALEALCVVCAFDLCGVRNRDDAPTERRDAYSRFDAAHASLAPWLVRRISNLSRDMVISRKEIRETFLSVAARLKVPGDPPRLWAVLQTALEGNLVADDEIRRDRAIRDLLQGTSRTAHAGSPMG